MTRPPHYQLPNRNLGLDLMRYRGVRRALDAQFTGTASGPRRLVAMR